MNPVTQISANERHQQMGQALMESLTIMLVLSALWLSVHWLANYQDMALSAIHASRHAAFLTSRSDSEQLDDVATLEQAHVAIRYFFDGPAHRWKDIRGFSLLQPNASVKLSFNRMGPLSDFAQPGTGIRLGDPLRREWSLEDGGLLQATLRLDELPSVISELKPLERSTRIATGAGHARSDIEVQMRTAASESAWRGAYRASLLAGHPVVSRAAGVDAAWARGDATFQWVQPWEGKVPARLLIKEEGN